VNDHAKESTVIIPIRYSAYSNSRTTKKLLPGSQELNLQGKCTQDMWLAGYPPAGS